MMKFYVKGYKEAPRSDFEYPCFVLITNTWNDYGYQILFKLFKYNSINSREEIGDVKILHETEKYITLSDSFDKLSPEYCSLGQDLNFYENFKSNCPNDYIKYLNCLNDIAINPGLRDEFEDHDGYRIALLRFPEAEKALHEAIEFLKYDNYTVINKFKFTYSILLDGAADNHIVEFDFTKDFEIPNRINTIIGKNGTGKTKYLSSLAYSLCDNKTKGDFSPARPLFSRVIAISFSLFDKFPKPKYSKSFSYRYIGLRTDQGILSEDEIEIQLKRSFKSIKKQNREYEWASFLTKFFSTNEQNPFLDINFSDKSIEELISNRHSTFSSGQNILFFLFTEIISVIRRDSLLIFDEPETHLHPLALSKLIGGLNDLLEQYNSYAILGTHSPIVIQETPARYVRVFDRLGNYPVVNELGIESFGENITIITEKIFKTKDFEENYKVVLENLSKTKSLDEILRIFEGSGRSLSINAQIFLKTIFDEKPATN